MRLVPKSLHFLLKSYTHRISSLLSFAKTPRGSTVIAFDGKNLRKDEVTQIECFSLTITYLGNEMMDSPLGAVRLVGYPV